MFNFGFFRYENFDRLQFCFFRVQFWFCSKLQRFDPSFWSQSPPKTRSGDPKTAPMGAQRAPKTRLRPKFNKLGSPESIRDEFRPKFNIHCVSHFGSNLSCSLINELPVQLSRLSGPPGVSIFARHHRVKFTFS